MAKRQKGTLVGVGLDSDGHKRITRSEDFVVLGGSKETHERLSEISIKASEELKKRGKDVAEVCAKEFAEVIEKASR